MIIDKIVTKYRKLQPLSGKSNLVCTHAKQLTARFLLCLQQLGSTVSYVPIPYSCDERYLMEIAHLLPILSDDSAIASALEGADIIIEDGARLSKRVLMGKGIAHRKQMFSIEQTTHGIRYFHDYGKLLPYPVISVAESKLKVQIENALATPEAVLATFVRLADVSLSAKCVLLIGSGSVGLGLAELLQSHGAHVSIIEIDSVKRLVCRHRGIAAYPVSNIELLLRETDIVATCTANYCGDLLTPERIALLRDGGMIFNAGSGTGEIHSTLFQEGMRSFHGGQLVVEKIGDDFLCTFVKMGGTKSVRILCSGNPVNLRAATGNAADVIDITFSLMLLSAIHMQGRTLGVHPVDDAVEQEVAELADDIPPAIKPLLIKATERGVDVRPYGGVEKFGIPGEVSRNFSLVRAFFRPGSQTIGHYHLMTEEAYYIENGSAMMTMWHYNNPNQRQGYPLAAGDYLIVPAGFVHHVEVTSVTDFVCLVIASPPFSFWDQFFLECNNVIR